VVPNTEKHKTTKNAAKRNGTDPQPSPQGPGGKALGIPGSPADFVRQLEALGPINGNFWTEPATYTTLIRQESMKGGNDNEKPRKFISYFIGSSKWQTTH